MSRLILACFLLALFPLSPKAGATSTRVSPGVPTEICKRLQALLPDAGQLGAECTEPPAFYSPETLYRYMNGGAEAFLAYDFVALAHAVYQKGDAEITVDVFDMGLTENAFGAYANERSPESVFIPLGAEGYQSDFLVNFFQDRYYVKLSGFSDTQKAPQFLGPFAESVTKKIGDGTQAPKELGLFAQANLLPHTEAFVRHSPLGREFLAPAYSARYAVGGKETLLVLSLAATGHEAKQRIARLRREVKKSGSTEPLSSSPNGFKGSTSYEGVILAFPQGSFAVIIINPPESETDFIRQVVSALDRAPGEAH